MLNIQLFQNNYITNPNKVYYVIQNPKLNKKKNKIVGISIEIVEYIVKNWNNNQITFKKVNKHKNKKFPNIIHYNIQEQNTNNEILIEKICKSPNKNYIISYSIFFDKKTAKYNKLMKLYEFTEELYDMYNFLKEKKNTLEQNNFNATDFKKLNEQEVIEIDIKHKKEIEEIEILIEKIKVYYENIQKTNYFKRLEKMIEKNPELAMK